VNEKFCGGPGGSFSKEPPGRRGQMKKKVLITGASGLLGRALVQEFLNNDFVVLAQYHTHQPVQHTNCHWLWADFSDLAGIHGFLQRNENAFADCGILINNYGPITSKKVPELTAEDFYFDFHHNVITAFEITIFFIKHVSLASVVNIGFEFIGEQRVYKKILTYAAAKNALLLMTKSFEQQYPHIGFHLVSPPTLEGAPVKAKSGKQVSPASAAKNIYNALFNQF
jgi:NAD(P)-dependent dehydrogenase (short-subunit alcohol dehydrogenase family)